MKSGKYMSVNWVVTDAYNGLLPDWQQAILWTIWLSLWIGPLRKKNIERKILEKITLGNGYFVWVLTHWGRVTHICVGELTIIVSDNGLSPGRRQAIIWTNAGILLIGPYGTNFNEILIEILTFSFTKMSLKGSFAKWRPFGLCLNTLMCTIIDQPMAYQ